MTHVEDSDAVWKTKSPYGFSVAQGVKCLAVATCAMLLTITAYAQDGYDASWFDPGKSYVKLGVVVDGVHAVSGQMLEDAGITLSSIDAATFKLIENGEEVPILYQGGGTMGTADQLVWAGRRNRGDNELWAFADEASRVSSDYFSIYTDTTYYWLTWGGPDGIRYVPTSGGSSPQQISRRTFVAHLESALKYYKGDGDAATADPMYVRGEGYYMDELKHTNTNDDSETYTIAIPGVIRSSSRSADIEVKLNSITASGHKAVLEVELDRGPGAAYVGLDSVSWSSYGFATLSASIDQDEVPASADALKVRVISRNGTDVNGTGAPNRTYIDYVEIQSVTSIVAPDGQTTIDVASGGSKEIDVSLISSADDVVALDPVAGRFAEIPMGGSDFADVPVSATRYYVSQVSAILPPVRSELKSAGTIPDLAGTFTGAGYLIFTTPMLRPTAEQLADYRRSPEGGSHTVQIVETHDVFDVFDYGRRSPIAVRRLMWHSRSWSAVPEFLMLWGDTRYSSRERPHEPWQVISFGRSSSDGWFSMQFDGPGDWSEEVATGRIPIKDNATGELFLQKLTGYEAQEPADWTKHALILAGGSNEAQQATLQYHSNIWSESVRQAPFGGVVTNFFKTSETVLDPTFRDSIEHAIKDGASWLGYFGHSSATRWEIIVNPPEDFGNEATLPVAMSLGCYNGAFGEDIDIFAEDVVLKSMGGAISHWGGTASSFIGPAAAIATPVYEVVFGENERILGRAITEAKRRFVSVGGDLYIATNLQYNLIGDPATNLILPDKPDFYMEPRLVRVEPFSPNPADDSLTVAVQVRNRGTVPGDSVEVRLVHWTPDSRSTEYRGKIGPVFIEEEIAFKIAITEAFVGENRLHVTIDPENTFEELDELNNDVERTQVVFSSGLTLIYPHDYGLVPTAQPNLRVSLSSQDAEGTPVTFQLDTVDTFDSPALVTALVTSPLAAQWTPPQPLEEGGLYFWRARVDDPSQPLSDWKSASFSIRSDIGSDGWYQQKQQFSSNETTGYIAFEGGLWSFKEYDVEFRVEQGKNMFVGAEKYVGLNAGYPAVLIDGDSGGLKGIAPVDEPTDEKILELENLLASAEEGDIVLARSRTFYAPWGWLDDAPETLRVKAAYASIGATEIDATAYQEYWVMITQVGGDVQEWVTPRSEEGTLRVAYFNFSFSAADTFTERIGPAKSWDRIVWNTELLNTESYVEVEVSDPEGTVLGSDLLQYPDETAEIDLSGISATTYPYIMLRALISDSSQATTPQLLHWYVTYETVPELIMDPSALALSADTVAEGQQVTVSSVVHNFGQTDATAVLVAYHVTDAENRTIDVGTDTVAVVPSFGQASSGLTFGTEGMPGSNRITADASMNGLIEAVTYNNLAVTSFVVRADQQPPAFSVRIDGAEYPDDPRRVTSTDDPAIPFVTARPTIEILVTDDSEYLPMTDTTNFHLSLDGVALSLDRPDIRFEPGTLEENEARIIFTPDFSGRDTTHTLNFWAKDASGNSNPTELSPYQVHFRIQNSAQVESVYPYPNPMSTSTQFAFQLRGADPTLVEDFRIRVYTLNGQLVREFDLVDDPSLIEGGGLRIGWNKVPWDTRDEDGHNLGSGVYLYKVFLRAEGQAISVNNDSGIDKLVVMR